MASNNRASLLVVALVAVFCVSDAHGRAIDDSAVACRDELVGYAAITAVTTPSGSPTSASATWRDTYLLPKLEFHLTPSEAPAWRREEKRLLWSYVALGALDAYQTTRRPAGFREINPLLGDHPSDAQVLVFKSVATWGTIRLAHRVRDAKRRRAILRLLNVVQLSIVLHNEHVTGGIGGD